MTDWPVRPSYSTSQAFLLDDFYSPALSLSTRYDRASGYFSSSLIAIAPFAYSSFVENGGRMRLICSPHVRPDDAQVLNTNGQSGVTRDQVVLAIRELAESSQLARALSNAMSALLRSGVLEVKFARPSTGTGLFHDKVGIFFDNEGNRISFVGSANETASAWSGFRNHEQIETFCSWKNIEQDQRSARHADDFEEMWLNLRPGLQVEPASQAAAIISDATEVIDLQTSLENVRAAIRDRHNMDPGQSGTVEARSPRGRPLRRHQLEVIDAWEASGHRGLVRFATGGGKTLVGIEATRRWTAVGRPALILVPSELLHSQWYEELLEENLEMPIVLAGAGADKTKWMTMLSTATSADRDLGGRIILATYQTAVTPDFRSRLKAHGDLLVVADEVHRMGAPDTRSLFTLDAGARLGLSATPERFGDEDGTNAIRQYFQNDLKPEFTLLDAITSGVLVPYDYFLETVQLTEDESEEYRTISTAMAKEMAMNKGAQTERFQSLARRRSRILKRAEAKTSLARRILNEHYSSGSHWLIYCESMEHLAAVRAEIEDGPWPILEYHSRNTALADEVFAHFTRGGVLLAIKCLDEGVDIPAIDNALILASTSNPREYVQRRGRILRRTQGKFSARLFDVVVLDDAGRLLAGVEAHRAQEFASGARNQSGSTKLDLLLMDSDGQLELPSVESDDSGDSDV